MTEYDYSPEAVTRYLRTQQRIARWTADTGAVPQVDPYAPPTPAASAAAPLPKDRRRTRSSDRDRDRDGGGRRHRSPPPPLPTSSQRPTPARSHTAPPRGDVYGVQGPQAAYPPPLPGPMPNNKPYYPAPPAGYYLPPQPQPQAPPHRRSRSSSQAPPPSSAQQSHSHSRSRSYAPAPPPPLRSNSYAYGAAPGYAAYPSAQNLPPLPPGYTYAYPAPPQQPVRSPTREVPLLKRVFGFGGGSGGGGSGRRTPKRGDTY
ncbi:hypothetical protein B0H11DRAFT_2128181 [Mycena galericulata]|nr:hypothetical protein B0H11DRAFT_2128181 [Mycena galericulata]